MPIYEYRCTSCQARFERIVFRKDEPIICPECQTSDVTRELSTFAVSTGNSSTKAAREPGPCACGAPQRGMCQME